MAVGELGHRRSETSRAPRAVSIEKVIAKSDMVDGCIHAFVNGASHGSVGGVGEAEAGRSAVDPGAMTAVDGALAFAGPRARWARRPARPALRIPDKQELPMLERLHRDSPSAHSPAKPPSEAQCRLDSRGTTRSSCCRCCTPPSNRAASTSARKVMVHVLNNVQNGLCAEDCGYCSQNKDSDDTRFASTR